MDTVNPGDRRDRSLKPQHCQVFSLTLVKPGKRCRLVLRPSCSTVQDVASIEGLLLLLQNIQVEGGSVSHFIVIIHHTPEGKVENFLQNPQDYETSQGQKNHAIGEIQQSPSNYIRKAVICPLCGAECTGDPITGSHPLHLLRPTGRRD